MIETYRLSKHNGYKIRVLKRFASFFLHWNEWMDKKSAIFNANERYNGYIEAGYTQVVFEINDQDIPTSYTTT